MATMLPGCGDGGLSKYSVTGLVTYDQKVVPTGTVTFLSGTDVTTNAAIGEDGWYRLEIPAGEYRVGIFAPRPVQATGIDAFKAPPEPPYLPLSYAQPKYSRIEVAVEAKEENVLDLHLQSKGDRNSGRR